MIWSDILAEIKRGLKEPSSGGHWTDAELLRRANIGQRRVVRMTHCLKAIDTSNTSTSGTSEYNKPSTCLRLLRVYYKYSGQRLYPITKDDLDIYATESRVSRPWTDDSDEPTHYMDEPSSIILFPKPNATGDAIGMEIIIRPTALAAAGDIPFNAVAFMEDYHDLIAAFVLWKCLLEDGDARADAYKEEFFNGLRSIIADLKGKPDSMDTFQLIRTARGRRKGPLPIHEG